MSRIMMNVSLRMYNYKSKVACVILLGLVQNAELDINAALTGKASS